jgi:hypothetical protein
VHSLLVSDGKKTLPGLGGVTSKLMICMHRASVENLAMERAVESIEKAGDTIAIK